MGSMAKSSVALGITAAENGISGLVKIYAHRGYFASIRTGSGNMKKKRNFMGRLRKQTYNDGKFFILLLCFYDNFIK